MKFESKYGLGDVVKIRKGPIGQIYAIQFDGEDTLYDLHNDDGAVLWYEESEIEFLYIPQEVVNKTE